MPIFVICTLFVNPLKIRRHMNYSEPDPIRVNDLLSDISRLTKGLDKDTMIVMRYRAIMSWYNKELHKAYDALRHDSPADHRIINSRLRNTKRLLIEYQIGEDILGHENPNYEDAMEHVEFAMYRKYLS